MIKKKKIYSLSIIIPIMDEINSLKKKLKIINNIQITKEYIIIYSDKLTPELVKNEIFKLKKIYKNLKYFSQIRPYVGGAIDLGIRRASKGYWQ